MKKKCVISEAIESRTETAHMGERDNPKMEPLQLQQKLRTESEAEKCMPPPPEHSESLRGSQVTLLSPKLFQSIEIEGTFPISFWSTGQRTQMKLIFYLLKDTKILNKILAE